MRTLTRGYSLLTRSTQVCKRATPAAQAQVAQDKIRAQELLANASKRERSNSSLIKDILKATLHHQRSRSTINNQ